MEALLRLADDVRATIERDGELDPVLQTFYAAANAAGRGAREVAISRLLAAISEDEPRVAGWLSIASGALVEMGADPAIGFDRLLDVLAHGAATLAAASFPEDAALEPLAEAPPPGFTPEQAAWARSFPRHVVGAMARLARDVALRKQARAHATLAASIAALDERVSSNHVYYLSEVIGMFDDEPLVLVDLVERRVTRYRAFAIRNGFHLITILEGHDLAHPTSGPLTARSGWFTWPAVQARSGWFGRPAYEARDLAFMVWGEPRPGELPRYRGELVAVRAAPVIQRSWDFSFVAPIHDALEEALVLEATLDTEATEQYLEQLAAAAAEARGTKPD